VPPGPSGRALSSRLRARALVAAVAGVSAAGIGHLLDTSGQLPFVHESLDVRSAMPGWAVVLWLAVAATLAVLAAVTRPVLVGAPCALVVSGLPELVGRHDIGAVLEPGAICGALVQWLLIAAVVAMALLADRQMSGGVLRVRSVSGPLRPPLPLSGVQVLVVDVLATRSRAPPRSGLVAH
jgi:hypothetical protein